MDIHRKRVRSVMYALFGGVAILFLIGNSISLWFDTPIFGVSGQYSYYLYIVGAFLLACALVFGGEEFGAEIALGAGALIVALIIANISSGEPIWWKSYIILTAAAIVGLFLYCLGKSID